MEPRIRLRQLICLGRNGRSLNKLFTQLRSHFQAGGETITWTTMMNWVEGRAFPATQRRQQLLAEVIGGDAGDEIRAISGLVFRGYRTRLSRERSAMRHPREFEIVDRVDDGGVHTKQARIRCAGCDRTYHHLRRGVMDSEVYFRRKGWEVGNHAGHDFCADCVAKRKVVRMSEHRKPPVVEAPDRTMSREDGRVLSRKIEEQWDDGLKHYLPGWSDTRLAADMGVPVDWVRTIRERDFGGTGDDPGIADFIARQVEIETEVGVLRQHMEELVAGVAEATAMRTQADEKVKASLDRYRDRHNKLSEKVHDLHKVAETLRPFEQAKRAG